MGTLIKKAEGWYNLYQDKIGIGSTYPELQGYKLSKQNCDEIFGVTDVERLAEYSVQEVKESNADFYLRDVYKEFFIEGFNKAIELNNDKQFTLEDMKRAISFGQGMDLWKEEEQIDKFIQSRQQPTEIEVEVEMEEYGYCEGCRKAGMWHCAHADTCGYVETRQQPKLDADGCIILKKAK